LIIGHHVNFSNAKGSGQTPSRTRQTNPISHHPQNSQNTNRNELRNLANHNQRRQEEHLQHEPIRLNTSNQHFAKESITFNHLDDCTKDGTLKSSTVNISKGELQKKEYCSLVIF